MVWSVLATITPVPAAREASLRPLTRWLRERGAMVSGHAYAMALARLQVAARRIVVDFGDVRRGSDADARVAAGRRSARCATTPTRLAISRTRSVSRRSPSVANLTGQPAITLPLGWSATGLPIGVMLTGRPAGEAALLGIGRAARSRHGRGRRISRTAGERHRSSAGRARPRARRRYVVSRLARRRTHGAAERR